MFNTISLARILDGKHPYREGATKEDYIKELQEEKKEKRMNQKGMSHFDWFQLSICFLCVLGLGLINHYKLQDIEKKVDIILENQKSSVVTPTPQKDVE